MKMTEAIARLIKENPKCNKLRVEDVLSFLIDNHSQPKASKNILFFDPEKCPIEESYLLVQGNSDLLNLCKQKPGTPITTEMLEQIFNNTGYSNSRI
jgi:hypothetical protein